MTPEAIVMLMQYGLLFGYLALLWAAVVVGWHRPRLRPIAFAAGMIAAAHAAFYVLFLWFPDVLDARETMLFSFALRYQVLGVATLILLLAVIRNRGWDE